MKPEKYFFYLLAAFAALFYAFFIFSCSGLIQGTRYFILFDDAMIAMQYARNLAEGYGLVWNPQDTAVEGCTNFLWTAFFSLFHLLPLPEPLLALAVMLVSAAILLANAYMVNKIAYHLSGDAFTGFYASLLCLFCFSLCYWTLRGMEVGILSLLIHIAVYQAFHLHDFFEQRKLVLIAILLSLCLLIRTDAVFFYGLISLFILFSVPRKNILPALLLLAAAGIGTLALHSIFRYAYYGDPLPNTYYLKMAGVSLGTRVQRGWASLLSLYNLRLLPLFAATVAAFLLRPALFKNKKAALLLGLFLMASAYSVYVGGDAWEWMPFANRYTSTTISSLIIIAALGLQSMVQRIRNASYRVTAGILLSLSVLFFVNKQAYAQWLDMGPVHIQDDLHAAELGLLVRQSSGPDARLAVVSAGSLAYFSHRYCVDLLGKNDPFIARMEPRGDFFPGHNKWDYRYSILTYEPDIIAQLWLHDNNDIRMIENLGYLRLPNGIFIRSDSRVPLDTEALGSFSNNDQSE